MKNKKILLILVTILLLSIVIFLAKNNFGKFNNNLNAKKSLIVNFQTFPINQKIVFNDGRPDDNQTFNIKSGESVLDLLARTKNIQVKEYSFGKMVTTIDNLKNGQNKKYWIYFINDQEAKIGASNYKLKPGERVIWKFKAYEQ